MLSEIRHCDKRQNVNSRDKKLHNVSFAIGKEHLASGNQSIFDNSAGWAKTCLNKVGIIESPKRATFLITERCKQALVKSPDRIVTKYLW